jgi:hypothetical protein
VVFEICGACDEWAGQTAQTNYIVSEMEAQAKLPPGARIMENPSPDVNPDA